jgi:hypothetical protein
MTTLKINPLISQIPHDFPFSRKKKEILPFAATWMNLEDIMLSEIIQIKQALQIPLICVI